MKTPFECRLKSKSMVALTVDQNQDKDFFMVNSPLKQKKNVYAKAKVIFEKKREKNRNEWKNPPSLEWEWKEEDSCKLFEKSYSLHANSQLSQIHNTFFFSTDNVWNFPLAKARKK